MEKQEIRGAIESAKLYKELIDSYDRVVLIAKEDGFSVILDDTYITDTFEQPYYALKDAYYRFLLDVDAYEDLTLDLPEELIMSIEKIADDEGRIVDDVIKDMLESYIEEHGDDDCDDECHDCGCECEC